MLCHLVFGDQWKQRQTCSSVRRSSLIVNLSTTEKRSSMTRLFTSCGPHQVAGGPGVKTETTRIVPTEPQSAPPSLTEPSYGAGGAKNNQTASETRAQLLQHRTSLCAARESSGTSKETSDMQAISTNRHQQPQRSIERRQNVQVTEIKHQTNSDTPTSSNASNTRRTSRDDSPEPIVEVKHTSSSSSGASSSSVSDCEDTSKIVRRRTVRRYHRATELEEQEVEPSSKGKTNEVSRRATAELTLSIGGNEHQVQQEAAKSHFRTRQIGAYYGQSKERQQQHSSSSSSSSTTSTSKIAKCSITTNRKSTSSSSRQLISETASSTLSAAKSEQSAQAVESSMFSRSSSSMMKKNGSGQLPSIGDRTQLELQLGNCNHLKSSDLLADIEVQQRREEEESHHRHQSFSSSTTSMLDSRAGLRKAAVSSTSSSSASAAMLSRHTAAMTANAALASSSSDLAASTSRHFKTSLIVASNNSSRARAHTQSSLLANEDESIFSTPEVQSLAKTIDTDFAELENFAISSTSASRGLSTLSTRLFGRRLLSPSGPAPSSYLAISNSTSGQSLSNQPAAEPEIDRASVGGNLSQARHFSPNLASAKDSAALQERYGGEGSLLLEADKWSLNGPRGFMRLHQSQGEKIEELLNKANRQADRLATSNSGSEPQEKEQLSAQVTPGERARKISASSGGEAGGEKSAAEKSHESHCKAVMSESIERIDQRMSDLCQKLNRCQDTKEAIDLLKIMIQMIEKAWSVPVCGDDLGFRLCNSLREAGGLDIILAFIHDSEDLSDEATTATHKVRADALPDGSVDMGTPPPETSDGQSSDQQQASSRPEERTSLSLNLSKLTESAESKQKSAAAQQPTAGAGATMTKDTDSDIITSDLGLDSASVESLPYESAPSGADSQSCSAPAANGYAKASQVDEGRPANLRALRCSRLVVSTKQASGGTEDDELDLENDVPIESGPDEQTGGGEVTPVGCEREKADEATSEQMDKEEALLEKDELVFLSARLLSQCLTSENRNYIVDNGLDPVVKLACQFTTMKSNQSQKLLSRSKTRLQSSPAALGGELMVGPKESPQKQPGDGQVKEKEHKNLESSPATISSGKQKILDRYHQAKMTGHQSHSTDQSDMHAAIGTEMLQHLFKHSEDTCFKMISLGGLQALLYGCRSSNVETLRHCASALANLALYGGSDSQQTMIEHKAHVWLFPLAFNEDDNIQYYACLAIVVLAANQEIEADVLKSGTLDLVEPFVTSHEPQMFAESTTAHIHGQSASWLRKLIPLLESKRDEACNLACFHFAMEAYIKKEQGQTSVFKEIGAVEPLRKVGSSPQAIASKFACQALRLIGEKEPHKLSQQVPLWTNEDVLEWVTQIGFEKFKPAFSESRVDGDLLLLLDEDTLRLDLGIENGIIRRRFLRELSNLKRIADYSAVDKSGLGSLFSSAQHPEFIQYLYPMVQLGVTKDNIHLLDSEQLLRECKVSNTIHRIKLAHSIKELQERSATAAASSELGSSEGGNQKTLDVFISYRRSTGSQLASLLKVHLQLRGFSVFIDVERLEAGKFDNNLLDSIKTAKNFILVLSPNALDRCIGDHDCKDWVHKEIVAALVSKCNIIPIMDNFHWPDADQLPEDMRSISYFNGVRWIHDYQDACVDKVERFIRGEIYNGAAGFGATSGSSQSSLQRLPGAYPSTPSIVATPSVTPFPSTNSSGGGGGIYSVRPALFDAPDYHPLSLASQYQQQQQQYRGTT